MAGLQRSEISFRRSGSSGLIWDDKLLSGELNQTKKVEDDQQQQDEIRPAQLERSRSANAGGGGGGGGRAYRTTKVSPPNIDPPSPKVSSCGICGIFGKPVVSHKTKTKPRKRKS